ncbi:MAG: CHAD domain-containing protein [Betaproteobacteria bacterium]|nr:CHAD domain-containing protein [Betaproteobacteria bacterium]
MGTPTEVELKLLIDPADIAKLRRHPLLKTLCPAGPVTRKLLSTYFDTDDFALKNQDIALRVRRDGRRWIQTVKAGGSVQLGLHQRPEWEAPVAGNAPDFTKITDPGLARLFAAEKLRQRLHPAFVTEFSRTIWLLKTASGDRIEMALDRGEIRAGQEQSPISEVELELKAGSPAALFELALVLQETVPLCTENASKAERGYLLCALQTASFAAKAAPSGVTRKMSVGAAFRAIAWNCIGQLQDNQSHLQQNYDPEYVHQMRVAVRRLRSALGLFATAAPGIKNTALIEELRWLAGQLGAARDWDVFLAEILPPVVVALPRDEELDWLRHRAASLQEEGREQARAATASQRFHKLLLMLGGWLWREPWRETTTEEKLDRPVPDYAKSMLAKRHRQLRRHGRSLASLTLEQRHALRIAAKKLRYATEFFSDLYSRKPAKRYLETLMDLQDEFGALNDRAVTRRLLARIGTDDGNVLQNRAIGVIFGWNANEIANRLAGMTQAWRNFKRQKIFWKKG